MNKRIIERSLALTLPMRWEWEHIRLERKLLSFLKNSFQRPFWSRIVLRWTNQATEMQTEIDLISSFYKICFLIFSSNLGDFQVTRTEAELSKHRPPSCELANWDTRVILQVTWPKSASNWDLTQSRSEYSQIKLVFKKSNQASKKCASLPIV